MSWLHCSCALTQLPGTPSTSQGAMTHKWVILCMQAPGAHLGKPAEA